MYKILIVEDEPFVRRSIRAQIDWSAMGFTLAGEARNGWEAIGLIEKHQPNLILCDIVMPVMDGLELLKYCSEKGFKGKFVMLTCMNEFEYARQALKYGAFEYILKLSMHKQDLYEVLLKVKQELDREQTEWNAALYYQYQAIYETIWRNLLGEQAVNPAGREDTPDRWRFVAVSARMKAGKTWGRGQFEEAFLDKKNERCQFHTFAASGVLFGFYWSERPVLFKNRLPQFSDETVVISPSVERDGMKRSWRQVLHTLDKLWYQSKPGVYFTSGNAAPVTNLIPLSWDIERKWLEQFENMDESGWRQKGMEVFKQWRDQKTPMFTVKRIAENMDGVFRKISGLDAGSDPGSDMPNLEDRTSHEECADALFKRMYAYQEWRKQNTMKITDHPEVNLIIEFIHSQYNRPITLQSMAGYVNLDIHYLSKLFKKKTGETLINYLQQHRVERAKPHLAETNIPVSEIGFMVGFANDNYFVKIFRRWTGMTPGHYRRMTKKT